MAPGSEMPLDSEATVPTAVGRAKLDREGEGVRP